jgi:glycosyltransferase involved in cell wall biosynthesis
MDGGSTDNSIEIIKKYANLHPDKIFWKSEKDNGQTDAINKGLALAKGEIMAYLNSDDVYVPDALRKVAEFFNKNPDESFLYGLGNFIDTNGDFLGEYPTKQMDNPSLFRACGVTQPAAFWKRKVLDTIGPFSVELQYAMDYDYWIRVSRHFKLNFLQEHLADTRVYEATKTSSKKFEAVNEILSVVKKHYGSIPAVWFITYVHSIMVGKFNLRYRSLSEHLVYRAVFPFAFIYALSVHRPKLDGDWFGVVSSYLKRFFSLDKS